MKAIVTTRYGPPEVLELLEVPTPAPADDEVLVEVHAAALNPLDSYVMRGPVSFFPLLNKRFKPKHSIMGADVAGRVVAVGKDITRFSVGDEVFGGSFGKRGMGGFAEYVCPLETSLALKPVNASSEEAAAVPVAALTALQGLRDKGGIKAGHKVLIDGSSGGVGTFSVQIAKSFGAEVTAVCSAGKMEMSRSLGADHVIDYAREDFTRSGVLYDLIVGANAHHSVFSYMRVLSRDGIFVAVGGNIPKLLQAMALAPVISRMGSKKVRFFIAKINVGDLEYLKGLIEAGKVVPVIDRTYPLSEVAEAMRYRELGHASGKVVIRVGDSGGSV
ncbi:MAG TPA: NAD(P)-dependent alcohol dehydrogenase [Acidisarcina sp.]